MTQGQAKLDGLTIDERGRPIAAISHAAPIVIGGKTLPVLPASPAFPPAGRAFVRLTPDGARIDMLAVPALKPGTCASPAHGSITSMAARGSSLAVLFQFGVGPECKITNEPTTVMTFDLPP